MQPSSEAYEAEDRCFRVYVARRLILPHPAAANPADVVQFLPQQKCGGPDLQQTSGPETASLLCLSVWRRWLIEGMQLLGDALRTLFNPIVASRYSLNRKYLLSPVLSTDKLNTLGWILSLTLTVQSRIWMCPFFALFSCNPSLVSAASTKPGLMAKRAEKNKFDRYPRINLVPFTLETTDRPGPHAKKFISYLLRDADNPPLAIRDTWSTIQSVLHSAISKQQLTAAVTWLTVTIITPSILSMYHAPGCKYRSTGNAHNVFSLKPAAAVPYGPAVTSPPCDDDEHNTDNNFLLLFADIAITPTLLEGLTEVDVLHIALG